MWGGHVSAHFRTQTQHLVFSDKANEIEDLIVIYNTVVSKFNLNFSKFRFLRYIRYHTKPEPKTMPCQKIARKRDRGRDSESAREREKGERR